MAKPIRRLDALDIDAYSATASEKALQEAIRHAALYGGWLYYHTWNSQRSPSGFPDVVLVKNGDLIVAELKTQRGVVSDAQHRWLDELARVERITTAVWRPTDLTEAVALLQGDVP